MKKIIVMLVAAGFLLAMPSCKKGENDPFLSFKSRDARITGVWNLTSVDAVYTNTTVNSGTITTNTSTTTYDGSLMTNTWTSGGGGSNSSSYSLKLTIEKGGTYKMVETDDGNVSDFEGYWWWLADNKKKTRIAFDDDNNSFDIDQLKNKEMIIKSDTYYKDTDTSGDSDEDVDTYTATYTKEK